MESFSSALKQPRSYRYQTYAAMVVAVIFGNLVVIAFYRFDFKHAMLAQQIRLSAPKFLEAQRKNISVKGHTTSSTVHSSRSSPMPKQTNKVNILTTVSDNPTSRTTGGKRKKAKNTLKFSATTVSKISGRSTTPSSAVVKTTVPSATGAPSDSASMERWYGKRSFRVPFINTSYPGKMSPPGSFQVTITAEERLQMSNLLQDFHKITLKYNITYMLYGGTLIGAYRHHGVVPWDDDIDVLVDGRQRDLLLKAMKAAGSKYGTWSTQGLFQWKFYLSSSKPFRHKDWRWPFIDIFFFSSNATHIWDRNPTFRQGYFSKKDVFPLRQMPFEGWTYPGPCNMEHYLRVAIGGVKMCKSTWYDHKHERGSSRPTQTVSCSSLFPYFPFVFRNRKGNTVTETLQCGSKVIHSILLPKYCNSGS